jgi:hypothetical protein
MRGSSPSHGSSDVGSRCAEIAGNRWRTPPNAEHGQKTAKITTFCTVDGANDIFRYIDGSST